MHEPLKTFRKKPVIITAVQYDGSNSAAIKDFLDDGIFGLGNDNHPVIRTLEGHMHVSPGDYVIRGVKGEFYPCKPDIFEQTYEAAE